MLIPKGEFIGLDGIAHLATGGESPMLSTHQAAASQFMADKALGVQGRQRMESVFEACRRLAGSLLSVPPELLTFLSSASEGVNLVAHALNWRPGDNVVISDVEFPSDVLPWTVAGGGNVEIRIVRHRDWRIDLEDIARLVDDRTRVVAISHVSYFTGQRQNLAALSRLVRQSKQALLLVDATHAAGVVPVAAPLADILVSSCYKWLLGSHGCAIFYWNRDRCPDLAPPFLGWNSAQTSPLPESPTHFALKPGADRFLSGNPNFLGLYLLQNALNRLLDVGAQRIEQYVLDLSHSVLQGLTAAGWQVITPLPAAERAGNICFLATDPGLVMQELASHGVIIFGGYGGIRRLRVSTHLYNDAEDVSRLLHALDRLPQAIRQVGRE